MKEITYFENKGSKSKLVKTIHLTKYRAFAHPTASSATRQIKCKYRDDLNKILVRLKPKMEKNFSRSSNYFLVLIQSIFALSGKKFFADLVLEYLCRMENNKPVRKTKLHMTIS
jgi:hypothetical protein